MPNVIDSLLFVGDVHGNHSEIDKYIRPEYMAIIQVGDFGMFPFLKRNETDYYTPKLNFDLPLYFCRGNHEDHNFLDLFPKRKITHIGNYIQHNINNTELYPPYFKELTDRDPTCISDFKNLYFCDNGSILNVNGLNILFIGGAVSIDKDQRTFGIDWFPQEVMSYSQCTDFLDNHLKQLPKIDIVVSHTCPYSVMDNFVSYKSNPFFEIFLSHVFDYLRPPIWMFGHYHIDKTFIYKDCIFSCLNLIEP